jgi:glycerol-3-phosphate O-acyltransferase
MREHSIREAALLYVRGGLVRQHVPGDTLTGSARKRARIYTGDDVIYTVPADQRLSLDLAKNIIVHLFVDRALVSVALLAPPGPPAQASSLRERVQSLSRLFKNEFMFRADASFDEIFDETIASMIEMGELARSGDLVTFGEGHDGLDGRGWTGFYARVVRNFLEGYRIAARAVRMLVRGPTGQRELVARALRIGEQMYLGGEIECSEAVSQPVMENAFLAFIDQGYLVRASGKLSLAESFASDDTAPAIEEKIAAYLSRAAIDPIP